MAMARVLVIDDDPTSCKVAAAMLKLLNCRVECAANGKEAAEWLCREPFDLLLLDWVMPIMNGEELTSLVRSGAVGVHHQRMPIIAVTADLVSSTRECCLQSGVNEYLTKPYDYKMLTSLVVGMTATRF